jgi:adenylyltransferase/sulfurtransferase
MSRYVRQIAVSGVGAEGQKRIEQAKALIVGAGGLGTPLAAMLAAAGVGTLGIADKDTIEISNLNRQFLYGESEIGQKKAEILTAKLKNQNPNVVFRTFATVLNENNIVEIFNDFDIICDCTDNVSTRLLLDETAKKLQKPLVYAAANAWEGMVTVLHYRKKNHLRIFFLSKPFTPKPSTMQRQALSTPSALLLQAFRQAK